MSGPTNWSTRALDAIRHDVQHAMRQLRRAPGFAAAVLTLGLGIGATTTIFGAVDSVVLRPFAWADPSHVVAVAERWHDLDGSASVGNYSDWRAESRSFAALAAEQFSPINLSDGGQPERASGGRVTSDFFRVFGVEPLLGRVFRPGEDEPGQDNIAVLSYGFWMHHFAGDPHTWNRVVRLNNAPATIVGVMPSGFDPSASGEEAVGAVAVHTGAAGAARRALPLRCGAAPAAMPRSHARRESSIGSPRRCASDIQWRMGSAAFTYSRSGTSSSAASVRGS